MPLRDLFEQNREWAGAVEKADPGFFSRLAAMQAPEYLWIGCADSRVPANEIVGLLPGELFVLRNVGNVVVHSDLNCLSVIQFAVEVLGVSHIMVVGHHRCGAVRAALQTDRRMGLIDHWLRHIEDVAVDRADVLAAIPEQNHTDALCELNVIEQMRHVARTNTVRDAWERGTPLHIPGWVYGLSDGLIQDLGLVLSGPDQPAGDVEGAVAAVAARHGA